MGHDYRYNMTRDGCTVVGRRRWGPKSRVSATDSTGCINRDIRVSIDGTGGGSGWMEYEQEFRFVLFSSSARP